jgi:hypothetical protein
MNVCVCLFCVCVVLCVGTGLATGWSPVQVVLQTWIGLRKWKRGWSPVQVVLQTWIGLRKWKSRQGPKDCTAIERDVQYSLICIVGGGVQLGPLGTAATNRPIVPAPGDYDDGEIGGMMNGRGNWSTGRKPASVPLCPPQTPHANPGRRGGKPATNRLSYGTAYMYNIPASNPRDIYSACLNSYTSVTVHNLDSSKTFKCTEVPHRKFKNRNIVQ